MSFCQVRLLGNVACLHYRLFPAMVCLNGLNLRLQDFNRFIACKDFLPQLYYFLLLPFDLRCADHRTDAVENSRTDLGGGVFQSLGFQFAFYCVQFGRGSMQFCACRLFLLRGMFDRFAFLLLDTEQFADIVLQILLSGNGVAIEFLRRNMPGLRAVDTSLQSVFGHCCGIGVLVLFQLDTRHYIVSA